MFGSFEVRQNDVYQYGGLIVDERHVTAHDIATLQRYAKQHGLRLFLLPEFIKIFYMEVFEQGTLCIGYNLNFDLSRVILDDGYGRYAGRGGFSLTLSNETSYPHVRIKHLHSRCFNVHFTRAKQHYGENHTFQGHFLDVQQLACTLADEKSLSLEKACEIYLGRKGKQKAKQHGIITPDYIKYNLDDVKYTYEVFQHVRAEFRKYELDVQITKVYSAASLGKQALRQCNVQPFLKQNPHFPPEIIGQCMSAYYGGRCEVRIRKKPTDVAVLDVNSTYPTINLLLDLWKYVTAEKITYHDDTENVQRFIDEFTYEQALDKSLWPSLLVLVALQPNEDVLPVRTQYDEDEETFNIGLNKITYNDTVYYFLPDVLASKLLTGKAPQITNAIRFAAEGLQPQLRTTTLCGITLDPKKQDLIRVLAEKRRNIKARSKRLAENDPEYPLLNAQQKALKILNNATTYGIYIELHPEDAPRKKKQKESDEQPEDLIVYSNKVFHTRGRYEQPGTYFNPIIGASITAGARLLLAIAETYVAAHGEQYAYMDTDSIFVPPHLAVALSDEFKSLNPYGENKTIFEIEDCMEDVLFYGISSKRYCLFHKDGDEITIPDGKKPFYKTHGLGYLTNPFKTKLKEHDAWHKQIWMDILRYHYHPGEREKILEGYEERAAITKLAITTKMQHSKFRKLNENPDGTKRALDKRIKAFNFFLVGYSTVARQIGRAKILVKPLAPYRDNPQEAIHEPFIDYHTGDVLQGAHYWKRLSAVFREYINHEEAKFETEDEHSVLHRRHLKPIGITYIGKEANTVETHMIDGWPINEYADEQLIRAFVLQLTPQTARDIGIKYRSNLQDLKRWAQQKEPLTYNTQERRKILKAATATKTTDKEQNSTL